jgi:hypothetical protein
MHVPADAVRCSAAAPRKQLHDTGYVNEKNVATESIGGCAVGKRLPVIDPTRPIVF